MRPYVRLWLVSLAATGFHGAAFAQAMVERALISGTTAAAAGPMQKVGKQTGAILENAGKSLEPAAPAPPRQIATQPRAATAKPVAPKGVVRLAAALKPPTPSVTYEDPTTIKPGMEYAELIRRFGSSSLTMTSETGQTLLYQSGDRSIEVELRDGKVAKTR